MDERIKNVLHTPEVIEAITAVLKDTCYWWHNAQTTSSTAQRLERDIEWLIAEYGLPIDIAKTYAEVVRE